MKELIERLRKRAAVTSDLTTGARTWDGLLEEEAADALEQQQWVSVETRLPESIWMDAECSAPVLVHIDYGIETDCIVCTYKDGKWPMHNVTHWKPITPPGESP